MRADGDSDESEAVPLGRPISLSGACFFFGLCLGILLGVVLALGILHMRGSL